MAIEAGTMELFRVQWNVPMETGLLTVMGKLIKHSSNRNPNQSLNQQLIPAVPSPCNQLGNCFTWNCLVGTGKLVWSISQNLMSFRENLFCIIDKKFNPPYFLCACGCVCVHTCRFQPCEICYLLRG